jgi:putative flippase GtrA
VVVPTRNEAGNIAALVARLQAAVTDIPLEIVFVDDSDDNTVAVIEQVSTEATCDITLLHRPPGERSDGLGGAVVAGLRRARAPWVCVMDADLQHPPEMVPQLCARAAETGATLVVASRYNMMGSTGQFGRVRSAISHSFTTAARVMFPNRLRGVSDPMSGFFLVRKANLPLDQLRPRGFKILLEILVRTPNLHLDEVGFAFGERYAGESKASLREGLRYLSHLAQLRFNENTRNLTRFMLIGLSGLLVNTLLLTAATEGLGIFYLWSAVLATQGSTLWNFALTEAWVFGDRRQKQGMLLRLLLFLVMNNAALLLRGPMMYLLTDSLAIHYVLSNLISLGALMAVRFTLADKVIWRKRAARRPPQDTYHYSIHDIITVSSDVDLPELEPFLLDEPLAQPTIRVRIGKVQRERRGSTDATTGPSRRVRYVELTGNLGFAMDITLGDQIDVIASPPLRYSPHVLYTNVVEPILRWTFVKKGYALVHGACISTGEKAYMVTARTDTGKTTTMLRVLAQQRRASDTASFLSDDLTLVARDGSVLCYPKPLTISHHTVRAINTALLTRQEQWVLPFQSRIHSRSGRRFAFLLTQTQLPVATINTLVQFLVPPPKYPVQRLVPTVKMARGAKLAGMFIIQRGGQGNSTLEHEEAMEILMTNCEDAYGFPPYPVIKSFLHGSDEHDLRAEEAAIIASAFRDCPTTLLRSTTMDWAERIAALVRLSGLRDDGRPLALQAEPATAIAATDGVALDVPLDSAVVSAVSAS